MSSSNLLRCSGLAAVLGGVLLPVSFLLRFVVGALASPPVLADTLEFAASVLIVFGLMGVYGPQHKETGFLGFLGFVLTITSYCIALAQIWATAVEAAVLGPLTGVTLLVGFVLLGIGSWKANKLPRWTAALWVVGSALIVPGFVVADILVVIGGVGLGIGLVGAGVKLWTGKGWPISVGRL